METKMSIRFLPSSLFASFSSSYIARALALVCAVLVIGMPRVVAQSFDANSPGGFGGTPSFATAMQSSAPIVANAPVGMTQLGNTGLGNSVAAAAGTQYNVFNDMTGAHAVKTNAGETGPLLSGLDPGPNLIPGAAAFHQMRASSADCADAGTPQPGGTPENKGGSDDELNVGGMTPLMPNALPGAFGCH
jgi:hypothetical protein